MKILVIGGMHGNEPLGPAVVALFTKRPVAGVSVALANQQAIAANSRFINTDLNRSFPGDSTSKDYEARRAAWLLQQCKRYDLVLDFHNTHCPGNDCAFVGQTAGRQLYDLAWFLGLSRVIVSDYDCINKYAPNCLSVEISLDSPVCDAQIWYERIADLASLEQLPAAGNLELYRFVYRITLQDKERLDLPSKNLRAFKPLPVKLANAMGVASPAYPIFIGDGYTPYNYGGLLNMLPGS